MPFTPVSLFDYLRDTPAMDVPPQVRQIATIDVTKVSRRDLWALWIYGFTVSAELERRYGL